jgi:hypothetical protein
MGVVLGVYLPLAVFSLVRSIRGVHFGLHVIWQSALRLLAIILLLAGLLLVLGLVMEPERSPETGRSLEAERLPDALSLLMLGWGAMIGFAGGVVTFVIGFKRGQRRGDDPTP